MPSLDSIASVRSKVDPTRTVPVMGAGASLGDFNGTVKIDRHANTTDTSRLKVTDYFKGICKNPVEPTLEKVMVRKLNDHHLEIKVELGYFHYYTGVPHYADAIFIRK